MKKNLVTIAATAIAATGCAHDVNVTKTTLGSPTYASINQRTNVAANTCDAQYKKDRQNYLSAVQAVIASGQALPNAAYNAVVMRCKTHMHCLEFQGYDEAKCYMAASDRKDAERRFSDLSEDLRRIEREHGGRKHHAKKKKHGKPNVNVTVTQSNDQGQRNDQSQTNDNHNGDRVEDQDVLVLCGDARNLLDRRCRDRCDKC